MLTARTQACSGAPAISEANGRFYPVMVAALTLAGAVLRSAYLFQGVRYDEAYSFLAFSSRPLSVGLSHYPYPNNHLFHTLLVHFTSGLFGSGQAALRIPAFIAGAALVPVGYLTLRELYDRDTGLLAAALIAASPLLIGYSANARGYSIQALVFLLLVLVAAKLKEGGGGGLWVAFVLLTAIGLYTVPTMLFFFASVFAWLALSALLGDTRMSRGAFLGRLVAWSAAAVGLGVLLYVPVIVNSGYRAIVANDFVKPLAFGKFAAGLPGELHGLWLAWSSGIGIIAGAVLAAGVVASLVFHRKMSKDRVPLAAITVIVCALIVVAQRVLPETRVFLPLLPLFLGFSAAGLMFGAHAHAGLPAHGGGRNTCTGRPLVVVMTLTAFTVLAALTVLSAAPYQRDDRGRTTSSTFREAEPMAAELRKFLQPGDVVFIEWHARPSLEYYFTRLGMDKNAIYHNEFGRPQDALNAQRMFLICDRKEGHGLEALLQDVQKNVPMDRGSPLLEKLLTIDGAVLYRARRR